MHRFFFSKYETKLGIIFLFNSFKNSHQTIIIIIVWIPKYAYMLNEFVTMSVTS